MSIWSTVIAAGVSVASQLQKNEAAKRASERNRDNILLGLQDNERARAAQEERLRLELASSEGRQASSNATNLEIARRRIMGDVLLKQGEGQEKLMLEDFRSSANRKREFQDAASVLAQVLSR